MSAEESKPAAPSPEEVIVPKAEWDYQAELIKELREKLESKIEMITTLRLQRDALLDSWSPPWRS